MEVVTEVGAPPEVLAPPSPSQPTSTDITTTNNTTDVIPIPENQDPEQKKMKKIIRKKRRPGRCLCDFSKPVTVELTFGNPQLALRSISQP